MSLNMCSHNTFHLGYLVMLMVQLGKIDVKCDNFKYLHGSGDIICCKSLLLLVCLLRFCMR